MSFTIGISAGISNEYKQKDLVSQKSVIIMLEIMNEMISLLQPYVEHECY